MCRGWCELSQLLFGWGQILYLELFAGHEESRRWNGKSTPVIKFSYFHFMEEAWNYPTFHFHSHFRYKARRHEIEINSAIKVSNTKTLFTLALENCLISNVMWLNNLFDCQYVQLRIQECFIIRFTNHLSVEALQVSSIENWQKWALDSLCTPVLLSWSYCTYSTWLSSIMLVSKITLTIGILYCLKEMWLLSPFAT